MGADILEYVDKHVGNPMVCDHIIAEIVRLRGEVAVTRTLLCQVYTDAYHAGHQGTVEGLYVDVLPVDRDTYWLEQVEGYAATPAPAMPNGVEGLRNALATLVRAGKRLRNRVVETRGFRCMDEHDLALDAADAALRAADNRDAAGVDRSGITPVFRVCTAYESGVGKGMQGRDLDNPYKPDTDEHEAWAHGFAEGRERSSDTPAAVPAGEAVVEAFDNITSLVRYLRQGGPAPEDLHSLSSALEEAISIASNMIQEISQEPEVPSATMLGRAREFLAEAESGPANDFGMVDRKTAHLAIAMALTHPPAAEAPAPVQAAPQEGGCHMRDRCECIGACKYGLGGNGAMECPACRLEAALQHRGDSRGGEG